MPLGIKAHHKMERHQKMEELTLKVKNGASGALRSSSSGTRTSGGNSLRLSTNTLDPSGLIYGLLV